MCGVNVVSQLFTPLAVQVIKDYIIAQLHRDSSLQSKLSVRHILKFEV